VLAVLAVVLPGCVEEPEPRLRVGTFLRPGFEPFYLARSLGYYDERRIQFVEFPSSSEMLLAYRNGAIDAATVTTDDVLRLAAEGQPVRMVLVLDYSKGADAILARPAISDTAALKGRKVAVESNSLGGYLLARALDLAGLRLADTQIISGRVDRLDRELAASTVDAVVAYEPYRTRLLRSGVQPIFDSTQLPGEIADVLIVPAPLAERPSAALRELAAGWFRALAHLAAQPANAAQRMAAREALTPEEFQKTLGLVEFIDRDANLRLLAGRDATLTDRLRQMAKFMAQLGMLPAEVDPAPLRSAALLTEDHR
jgi:NitT/TauT family transport system substrate-binding protein